MREIKFRAWDDVLGMCEVIEIDFMSDTVEVGGKKTTHHYVPEEKRESYTLNIENAHLMQYAGLKDKNGKEIYEGDLIKYYGRHVDHYNNRETVYEIQYHPLRFEGIPIAYLYDKDMYGDWCGGGELKDFYSYEVEVIGNLYENPELLKDKES